ncbi:MAG: ABC transporter permease [Lachnospiraceae bacterium]|nr:ABC transporter permease [Lachnospiraceae bacterium]MBQ3979194.1 ABC transporter permease [Lachnospiraceae bacterium]
MKAIYKKELRSYFTSFLGYLFVAFLLIFVSIFQYLYNLRGEYANFALAVNGTATFFLLLVPMLTMRILAEEKRQRTDQLIFTAPVSVTRIVLGKYLALVTVFGIACLFVCFYPLILHNYGATNYAVAYTTILAFFLLGCTYMAIGMFISALTESQVFAAVVTFIVILFTLMIDMLVAMLPTGHLLALGVLIGLALIISVITYVMMKSKIVTGAFAVISVGGLITAYLINEQWFDGSLAKVFGWISVQSRFSLFRFGIVDISSYVYYLSMIFLFVFLTVQAIKKRRWEA